MRERSVFPRSGGGSCGASLGHPSWGTCRFSRTTSLLLKVSRRKGLRLNGPVPDRRETNSKSKRSPVQATRCKCHPCRLLLPPPRRSLSATTRLPAPLLPRGHRHGPRRHRSTIHLAHLSAQRSQCLKCPMRRFFVCGRERPVGRHDVRRTGDLLSGSAQFA